MLPPSRPSARCQRRTLEDVYEVVHAFDRGTDGDRPTALIEASDGTFYGTTRFGGVYNNGSVYRLTPDGAETVLHSFAAAVDGTTPSALIEGRDGNFYGTAQAGTLSTFGSIARVAPDGAFQTVHPFTCGADGAYPSQGLVQADDGNVYGTTLGIGTPYCSSGPARLFRMTPDGTLSTIYLFNSQPTAPSLSPP